MKRFAGMLCALTLTACQTTAPDIQLADCKTANTTEQQQACQEQVARDLQNLRRDIRKVRRTRDQ